MAPQWGGPALLGTRGASAAQIAASQVPRSALGAAARQTAARTAGSQAAQFAAGEVGKGLGSQVLSFLGGPWGAAAMTGLQLGSKLIGRGRRAADRGVRDYEDPFNRELAEIVRRRDQGDIEGARQQFGQAWDRYRQGVGQGFAQGGKDALVAQQSLNNPLLRQTADSIAQSLGVGALSWGRNQETPFDSDTGSGGPPNWRVGANTPGMGSWSFPQQNAGGNRMAGIGDFLWGMAKRGGIEAGAGILRDWALGNVGYKTPDLRRTEGINPELGPEDRDIRSIKIPRPWETGRGGDSGTNWLDLIPFLTGLGGNITGTVLSARDQAENRRREDALRERYFAMGDEQRRLQDYYARTLMPNLLRGTGFDTAEQRRKQMALMPRPTRFSNLPPSGQATSGFAAPPPNQLKGPPLDDRPRDKGLQYAPSLIYESLPDPLSPEIENFNRWEQGIDPVIPFDAARPDPVHPLPIEYRR